MEAAQSALAGGEGRFQRLERFGALGLGLARTFELLPGALQGELQLLGFLFGGELLFEGRPDFFRGALQTEVVFLDTLAVELHPLAE